MKKRDNRIQKMETVVQRVLSELLTFEIRDPRIGPLVSVSNVELSGDYSYATVYIAGAENEEAEKDLLEGLESAKGFMRSKLAGELSIYKTPELIFKLDQSVKYLDRIDQLINEVKKDGVSTNSLEEVGRIISDSDIGDIAVLPHVFADGDALGSAGALALGLKAMGKNAVVVMDEQPAKNIAFLLEGIELSSDLERRYDMAISVDTSSPEQMRGRQELFEASPRTVSIDHHKTNTGFADVVYVDDKASATGEIIFDLLNLMGVELDGKMAMRLYAAINSDTGSFKHTNTTARTFEIAAELMKIGFDFYEVNYHLHKNIPAKRVEILKAALDHLEVFDSVIAVTETLDIDSVDSGDYDGVTDYVLSIENIEVAAFARRLNDEEIKFSLRSLKDIDVSKIASELGGGGHTKAAGFVSKLSYDELKQKIVAAVRASIAERSE